MPKVTNTTASQRGFTRFAEVPEKGKLFSRNSIEWVAIDAGKTVEVPEEFLETQGAKDLIERGDLVVEGDGSKSRATDSDSDSKASSKGKSKGGDK